MCGIAGLINLDGAAVSPPILKRMTEVIAHRGPDSNGHWHEQNIGIGHVRLSIIDLSAAGHQPMASADQRYLLSYNGEIYNYRELRSELEAMGYQFRSKTDAEVVLYAFVQWKAASVERFNGMFAFTIYDRKERKLFLARDRYGIKPLYYARQGNTFAFASEQKAILTIPTFKRELDKAALLEYFTFQNIFTDRTLIEDVKLLPAGHFAWLDVAQKEAEPKTTRYWDYCFQESAEVKDKHFYTETLDHLFHQAVNRQLVGDVELGAYLSGGMDSGAITAVAASSFANLKSFTCGFDLSSASGIELGFDERVKAEAMSARFKTEHYQMVLKAGDMERCLPRLAYHLEEPRVGQSYPNYYAAKLASKFVKVVLSGAGSDELFGGYPWRYYQSAASQDFEHYIDQYYSYWQRLVSNQDLKKIFAPIDQDVKHIQTRDIFRGVFATHENKLSRPEDYINHSLYFEAKTFLHGLFVVEDKLNMAHGLEARVPFMDNDLVDFAMTCPVAMKLNNLQNMFRINENEQGNKTSKYFQKTNDGKQILRDVMRHYIPDDITKAVKQGFSSPDASWFKGESIDFVKRKLGNPKSRLYDLFDFKTVNRLIDDHVEGQHNRRLLIWSLLNVDSYIEGVFLR